MIEYRKYKLANGLTVLTHEAWDTPLATVNVLYNVGARDENPSRTGFAHLFEHLMFGGTERVPDFDAVVSGLGGDDNAFTNNDYTNYYTTVPAEGFRTALMLEADRMSSLALNAHALAVQQRVVTEEYNQRYMNRPYGDVWLMLRPLCYKVHPYRWATIGADIRHVSEATLEDVQAFHDRYYRPENAILCVAAPLKSEEMVDAVCGEWSAGVQETTHPCPSQEGMADRSGERCYAQERKYPEEPEQTAARRMEVEREVPSTALYMAWPMGSHFDKDFRACDLVSDVLGNGTSSRIYNHIVRPGRLVSEADAYISGDADRGLMVLSAKLLPGVDVDEVADVLRNEARMLIEKGIEQEELQKVQNKYESTFVYSQYKASDRAYSLCHYTWLGNTELANSDPEAYRKVTPDEVRMAAKNVFRDEKENMLVVNSRQTLK